MLGESPIPALDLSRYQAWYRWLHAYLVKDFNGDALPDLLITSFSKSPLYLLQNGLDKFYGVNIEADISGATKIIALPGGKEGKTELVVSSFDKRLLYKLELDAIE